MTDAFITELTREIAMRCQVYPGRVALQKMTQVTADRKIQLMQDILHVFQYAHDHGIPVDEMRLPIDGSIANPWPTVDLSAHIKEAESEKKWREIMLQKSSSGPATKSAKTAQLATLVQIISILKHIQAQLNETTPTAHQTTLF